MEIWHFKRSILKVFIKNFLSDRNFRVRIGSTLSEKHDQETGVPQGSILSVHRKRPYPDRQQKRHFRCPTAFKQI